MGVRFSPLLPGVVCLKGVRCDAGSFNGRTRVFEARHEHSIRSPAARLFRIEVRGVVKATVTSHLKKTPLLIVPSSCCEVIQLALTRFMHVRIVPSQPKSNAVAESSGRMPDCLSGGTGSTPVATATGVRTRWEGRWSPKPVLA